MNAQTAFPFLRRPGAYQWAICPACEGEGKVCHSAFSNGITSSEWAEWDQGDRDSYMAGGYDVPCGECEGGRVREPVMARLTFAEKRRLATARRDDRWRAEDEAIYAAERRMGA